MSLKASSAPLMSSSCASSMHLPSALSPSSRESRSSCPSSACPSRVFSNTSKKRSSSTSSCCLLDSLPAADRELIRLRFYAGRTQSETARLLHTTQVQVSRRERKILGQMRAKLLESS